MIHLLRTSNQEFLSLKSKLLSETNNKIGNSYNYQQGLNVFLRNKSFKVLFVKENSHSRPICVNWIGCLIRIFKKEYLLTYVGLPISFWITFLAFLFFCFQDIIIDFVGVGIAVAFLSFLLYSTKDEYSKMKKYAIELLTKKG